MMKPILVHAHIYYPALWPELRDCIKNVEPHPYELYITMVEKHKDVIDDIKNTFPNANIEIVENRGFDIGPFIHIINKVNLDEYSYIVKLHTKRDLPVGDIGFRKLDTSKWREALLSFIKTPKVFNQYLKAFENPSIGMQAKHTIIIHHHFYDKKAQKGVRQYLKNNHYPKYKYAFVGGTMFVAKAEIFKDIQNLHLTLTDFPDPKGEHKTQLAHIMERLFGYFVYKNGFIVRDGVISAKKEFRYHKKEYIMKFIYPIVRFFYQKKVTKSGNMIIKICKIPVYWRKV